MDAVQLLEVQLPKSKLQEIRDEDIKNVSEEKLFNFIQTDQCNSERENGLRIKKKYEQAMHVVEFAQNALISYCRNPTILSNSLVKIVNRKLEH